MSELDSLIMNNSHVDSDTNLPTMMGDTPDQVVNRAIAASYVKKRLKSLDARRFSFAARDVVEIELSNPDGSPILDEDGAKIMQEIEIQSLSEDKLDELAKPGQECVVNAPTRFDPETKQQVTDRQTPGFMEYATEMARHQKYLMYGKLLHGMVIDEIVNRYGEIVWSNKDDSQRDMDKAIKCLNDMGIREDQITKLVDAIDALSGRAQQADEEELTKK